MTHERSPSSALSSTSATNDGDLSPQQKAARTRRIRKAAREAEARQRAADALAESLQTDIPRDSQTALQTATPANLPATTAPALDAHGFDPSEYKWLPVKRKARKDGWTPQRQRQFIGELAATGSVERAAMLAGMSPSSAHRLRRSPGAEQFSAAWDVALEHAARVLLDVAFERAFEGTSEPVFDRDGNRCGTRHKQNDRLLMFLLRAYMPDRFRHAHRDWRSPEEALPPPPAPVDDVLAQIEPVPPAQPHALLSPDELEDALQVADILDGALPGEPYTAAHAARRDTGMSDFDKELERLKHCEDDQEWNADSA